MSEWGYVRVGLCPSGVLSWIHGMHSLCHDLIPLIFMKIALTSANVVPCVYVLWYDLITLCVPTVQVTALPLALPPRISHDYYPTLAALIAKASTATALGKNFRPALRLWGERPDVHLLKRHFGSSVAIWLQN